MHLKLDSSIGSKLKGSIHEQFKKIFPQMRIPEKTCILNEKLNKFSHANVRPICNYAANAFKQSGNCLFMM